MRRIRRSWHIMMRCSAAVFWTYPTDIWDDIIVYQNDHLRPFGAFFYFSVTLFRRYLMKGNRQDMDNGNDTRIAVITIIVEDRTSAESLNQLLHKYGDYLVGRMGVPYRPKEVSVICAILDAPQDIISALSGKIGMLPGITSKTVYSKLQDR